MECIEVHRCTLCSALAVCSNECSTVETTGSLPVDSRTMLMSPLSTGHCNGATTSMVIHWLLQRQRLHCFQAPEGVLFDVAGLPVSALIELFVERREDINRQELLLQSCRRLCVSVLVLDVSLMRGWRGSTLTVILAWETFLFNMYNPIGRVKTL